MASVAAASVLRLKHVRALELLQTSLEQQEELESKLEEAKVGGRRTFAAAAWPTTSHARPPHRLRVCTCCRVGRCSVIGIQATVLTLPRDDRPVHPRCALSNGRRTRTRTLLSRTQLNRGAKIDAEERKRMAALVTKAKEEKDKEIAAVQALLEASKQRELELNKQLDSAAANVGSTTAKLTAEVTKLQKELVSRDESNTKLRLQIDDLVEELSQARRLHAAQMDKLEQDAKGKDSAHAAELARLRADFKRTTKEREAGLMNQLDELEQRSRRQMAGAQDKYESMREELDRAHAERDSAVLSNEQLHAALEALQRKVRMLEADRHGSRFAEFVDLKKSNEQLHSRVEELQKRKKGGGVPLVAPVPSNAPSLSKSQRRAPGPPAVGGHGAGPEYAGSGSAMLPAARGAEPVAHGGAPVFATQTGPVPRGPAHAGGSFRAAPDGGRRVVGTGGGGGGVARHGRMA